MNRSARVAECDRVFTGLLAPRMPTGGGLSLNRTLAALLE
jgi:hypothetical protein